MIRSLFLGACIVFPTAALSAMDGACVAPLDKAQPDWERGATDDPKSLAEALDNCNGVLKPPRVGDGGISRPPPEKGETPVIRPGEIPQQHSG
jgi:hypothetical protein